MYRKFKPPFFWPAIAQDRQSCQSHFCLMKNPLLYRSAWPESSREASERFLMETLGKNYRPIRQHSGSSRRALQTGRGASTDTHSDSRCFAAESHCGRRRTTATDVWVKSPSRVRIPLSASSTAIKREALAHQKPQWKLIRACITYGFQTAMRRGF